VLTAIGLGPWSRDEFGRWASTWLNALPEVAPVAAGRTVLDAVRREAAGDATARAALAPELRELVAPAEAIFLDAKIESELIELPDEEALELLQSVGQDEPGLHQLIRVGFATLGLQTFLTAGPKESRAWTIPVGARAPEAAGVIHTDFQRGFIKAEVVSFDHIVAAGSMAEARAAGRVRIEGKDYVMADGDVVDFRFNV